MASKYPLLKAENAMPYQIYKNSGKPLPSTLVSLRNLYGSIQNQGAEGSCSAFAALQFRMTLRKLAGLSTYDPSEQAQYFEERVLENTVSQDSGATLEDALYVLEHTGVMPEQHDSYTPQNFAVDPPYADWDTALKLDPGRVQKIDPNNLLADTLDALNNGHPVLFGFEVFQGLESAQVAQTGLLPMPGPNDPLLGGHAVNAIGFDPVKQMILILNQWGADWGIKSPTELQGCFWMPYEYYSRYVFDAYAGFPDTETPQVWYIQLGSFADGVDAHKCLSDAEAKGLPVFIKFIDGEFKVLMGETKDMNSLVAELPKVQETGYSSARVVEY